MTSRRLLNYRKRLARGWSESTLYRWWTGPVGSTGHPMAAVPGLSTVAVLFWVLVVLAIS